MVAADRFTLLTGEAALADYQFGAQREHHYFCKHCGVRPFGLGNSPRMGRFYGVSVTCLDDAAIEELATAPVRYIDGLRDEWDVPPVESRHL